MRALGCMPMTEGNPPVTHSEWSLMSPPRYSVYSVSLLYQYKSTSSAPSMRALGSMTEGRDEANGRPCLPHVLSLLAFASTTVQILTPEELHARLTRLQSFSVYSFYLLLLVQKYTH
jgi:hypothetical protein